MILGRERLSRGKNIGCDSDNRMNAVDTDQAVTDSDLFNIFRPFGCQQPGFDKAAAVITAVTAVAVAVALFPIAVHTNSLNATILIALDGRFGYLDVVCDFSKAA